MADDLVHVCGSCVADLALDRFEHEQADRPKADRSPLLTVAETARYLRVTPGHVRLLIAERKLVAVDLAHSHSKNGHRWRVSRKSLKRLLLADTSRD